MEIGVTLAGGDSGTPTGRGRVILTASRAGEYSFEGVPLDGKPTGSVFTTALVEGIRSGVADRTMRGWVTAGEAYDYAFDRVREHGSAQTPQMFTEGLEGSLLLSPNPAVPEVLVIDEDRDGTPPGQPSTRLASAHLRGIRRSGMPRALSPL